MSNIRERVRAFKADYHIRTEARHEYKLIAGMKAIQSFVFGKCIFLVDTPQAYINQKAAQKETPFNAPGDSSSSADMTKPLMARAYSTHAPIDHSRRKPEYARSYSEDSDISDLTSVRSNHSSLASFPSFLKQVSFGDSSTSSLYSLPNIPDDDDFDSDSDVFMRMPSMDSDGASSSDEDFETPELPDRDNDNNNRPSNGNNNRPPHRGPNLSLHLPSIGLPGFRPIIAGIIPTLSLTIGRRRSEGDSNNDNRAPANRPPDSPPGYTSPLPRPTPPQTPDSPPPKYKFDEQDTGIKVKPFNPGPPGSGGVSNIPPGSATPTEAALVGITETVMTGNLDQAEEIDFAPELRRVRDKLSIPNPVYKHPELVRCGPEAVQTMLSPTGLDELQGELLLVIEHDKGPQDIPFALQDFLTKRERRAQMAEEFQAELDKFQSATEGYSLNKLSDVAQELLEKHDGDYGDLAFLCNKFYAMEKYSVIINAVPVFKSVITQTKAQEKASECCMVCIDMAKQSDQRVIQELRTARAKLLSGQQDIAAGVFITEDQITNPAYTIRLADELTKYIDVFTNSLKERQANH